MYESDAKRALKAISNHSDAIIGAYTRLGFGDTNDDVKAIEALSKYRLISHLDEDENARIRNVLAKLLHHLMGRAKQASADASIAALWDEIQIRCANYKKALTISFEDALTLENEIQELLGELIEEIGNATSDFSYYISTGFSHVTSLDLRITLNEQAINQAKRLNDVMESFRYAELQELASVDFLRRMLLKILPRELENARKNLASAINILTQRLVTLRKDAALTNLVISFERHYSRDPNFMPSIGDVPADKLPFCLRRSSAIIMTGYCDLITINTHQLNLLSDLISTIPDKRDSKDKPETAFTGEIEIAIAGDVESIEPDEIDTAIHEIVDLVVNHQQRVTVREVLNCLSLDIRVGDFMAITQSYINALPESTRVLIKYEFIGDAHPQFKDVLIAEDMVLQHA